MYLRIIVRYGGGTSDSGTEVCDGMVLWWDRVGMVWHGGMVGQGGPPWGVWYGMVEQGGQGGLDGMVLINGAREGSRLAPGELLIDRVGVAATSVDTFVRQMFDVFNHNCCKCLMFLIAIGANVSHFKSELVANV